MLRHPFLTLLTGGYVAFVGWLTLTPQPLDADDRALILRVLAALHRRGYVEWLDYDRLEFLANIALFVPIGMFFVLLLGARRWWLVAIGSMTMTAFIESAQHRIPGRFPDDRDLFANSVGGLLGIAAALVVMLPATWRRRRRERQRTG